MLNGEAHPLYVLGRCMYVYSILFVFEETPMHRFVRESSF